jgi:hypothetical protein
MAVKLLPKAAIAELKAKETSREIQEGAKLATRVDGLRTLWAKTEQDFELYKTSTLAAINEEITKANNEKERLTSEIKKMQVKYDTMMPEISMKRQELAQFEKSLTSWDKKLEKREENVLLGEIDIADATKKAEDARIRAENDERISANLLKQANEKKEQAEVVLVIAKNLRTTAEKEKKDIEQSLSLREMAIKAQEQELLTQQMNLQSDRKLLSIEKIRVADMRATLERSLERLKQGRLA